MGPSPKANSNPRPVEPINRSSHPHFLHIQHSPPAPKLELQRIYNYQAERIKLRTCRIQELKSQGASSYQARRINPASLRDIEHLQNSKLRLQGASSYQARRIRNYRASERSQPLAEQEQGAFKVLQFNLQPSRASGHALESLKSSGD